MALLSLVSFVVFCVVVGRCRWNSGVWCEGLGVLSCAWLLCRVFRLVFCLIVCGGVAVVGGALFWF